MKTEDWIIIDLPKSNIAPINPPPIPPRPSPEVIAQLFLIGSRKLDK